MIELRHNDACHFVILEYRHLAKGCGLQIGCIGLMLFRNLSCLGTTNMLNKILQALFRYMHAQFVTLWLQVVQPLTDVHETKWTPHVKGGE